MTSTRAAPTPLSDPSRVFDVTGAGGDTGLLVFASPHSGSDRPADMGHAPGLSLMSLRSAEDAGVDALIAGAVSYGTPIIAGRVSRAYVDLNRAPDELDPALIDGVAASTPTAKVAAGFGVVPRLTGDGAPLYDRRLDLEEAQARLDRVHRPYHDALDGLMLSAHERHGMALLIDWHSMPSRATGSASAGRWRRGVDIVLGDRHGSSCRGATTRRVKALFEAQGWRVGVNAPYAGGYSTQCWGRPDEGFQALQVELSRALYLNEATLEPSSDHDRVVRALDRVIAGLCAEVWHR